MRLSLWASCDQSWINMNWVCSDQTRELQNATKRISCLKVWTNVRATWKMKNRCLSMTREISRNLLKKYPVVEKELWRSEHFSTLPARFTKFEVLILLTCCMMRTRQALIDASISMIPAFLNWKLQKLCWTLRAKNDGNQSKEGAKDIRPMGKGKISWSFGAQQFWGEGAQHKKRISALLFQPWKLLLFRSRNKGVKTGLSLGFLPFSSRN